MFPLGPASPEKKKKTKEKKKKSRGQSDTFENNAQHGTAKHRGMKVERRGSSPRPAGGAVAAVFVDSSRC